MRQILPRISANCFPKHVAKQFFTFFQPQMIIDRIECNGTLIALLWVCGNLESVKDGPHITGIIGPDQRRPLPPEGSPNFVRHLVNFPPWPWSRTHWWKLVR